MLIRVHSWFKHCLDDVFAYSCPFVSIRGSPSSPSFVFFRVFRAFRGSNTAWTAFLHIRVHSCPFVSIRVHSWFKHYLGGVFVFIFVYFVYFVVQELPFLGVRAINQFEARTKSACSAVRLCFASYGMIFPETRLQLSRILT